MKSIIAFTTGVILRTVAAPVIVTGKAAQGTAKGIIKAGVAINDLGIAAELKGLKCDDNGSYKMTVAKVELAKSREERKLEREQARNRRTEDAIVARRARIAELEAQRKAVEIARNFAKGKVLTDLSEVMACTQQFTMAPAFAGQPG